MDIAQNELRTRAGILTDGVEHDEAAAHLLTHLQAPLESVSLQVAVDAFAQRIGVGADHRTIRFWKSGKRSLIGLRSIGRFP